jgi:hypothetical protein
MKNNELLHIIVRMFYLHENSETSKSLILEESFSKIPRYISL